GLLFDNMFTAACMCTPSRGALLSGAYPITTGITNTPEEQAPGDSVIAHFTSVLAGASTPYSCYWIGKWHLPGSPTDYGFLTWDGPPDAGTTLGIDPTLGGPLTQGDKSSPTPTRR